MYNECPRNFQSTKDAEDLFIISESLFDEDKHFILIDVSFCEKNESNSKDFIKRFHHLIK